MNYCMWAFSCSYFLTSNVLVWLPPSTGSLEQFQQKIVVMCQASVLASYYSCTIHGSVCALQELSISSEFITKKFPGGYKSGEQLCQTWYLTCKWGGEEKWKGYLCYHSDRKQGEVYRNEKVILVTIVITSEGEEKWYFFHSYHSDRKWGGGEMKRLS